VTKYYVTQVYATEGVRSANEPPITVSPNYPRLERAQNKALALSGVDHEDANWWLSEDERYHELHRQNGSWTGYAVRQIN
jgi:hypothetical protein